ncbi:DUF1156 domain-containing protein [Chloroflexota bacterium]
MTPTDKRLIEDYIPIKAISAEASREKSIRHGHISTLHLWWARRPLVASRAAVFAALVPEGKTQEEKAKLNELMIRLCKWKVDQDTLDEARAHITAAYPDGPPKVLDMFAGGGAIPLEALRLGCEAYALDLNPVAHIIELATLVYPQKYGPQLAEDVRKWGEWVLERVRAEVGDLYPLIPDPAYTPEKAEEDANLPTQPRLLPPTEGEQLSFDDVQHDGPPDNRTADVPPGYLQPVAYLWTRTVTCPNPACGAAVPLVRQTWLKKKKGDNVALEMKPHPTENRMAFHVRYAEKPEGFGFDPAEHSKRGHSVCGHCGTTVNNNYVKEQGRNNQINTQPIAIACVRPKTPGKAYLSPDDIDLPIPNEDFINEKISALEESTGITPPYEKLVDDPRNIWIYQYGFSRWKDIFTPRQLLALLTFTKHVRSAYQEMIDNSVDKEYAKALTTYLGVILSRLTDFCSSLCVLYADGGRGVTRVFVRQSLPMVWDFAETNPFNPAAASWQASMAKSLDALRTIETSTSSANVIRSSATLIPIEDQYLDAVITDPLSFA